MTLQLKGLIIDKHSQAHEELQEALRPDVEFGYVDVVNTFHKALEYHIDMEFHVCLIGEAFPMNEINGFLRDYDKLNRDPRCIFVQIKKHVEAEYKRDSLVAYGITTVISKDGDESDRAALTKALQPVIITFEKKEISDSLDSMINHLLDQVDKAAQDMKRGVPRCLHSVYGKHIAESSEKYQGLDQDFYKKLIESTSEAKPFAVSELAMPENILNKNLPHLSKSKYKGRSNRVWNMLLNKHGVGGEKEAQSAETIEEKKKEQGKFTPEE